MNNKNLSMPAFVGNNQSSPSSSSLCFPSPKNEKRTSHRNGLCGCYRAPRSHCLSAFGVLILVMAYTAMGSMLFMSLEGEDDEANAFETSVAASKPYPRTELANSEIRTRTVDRLWEITEHLNILYKENWTLLAAREVQLFQDNLLRAAETSKTHQTGTQPTIKPHKWTYASALLYSLTLITTIGYGGISPRTQWGRIAAIIYALFGIPLVLLYLSAMGEGLSAGMRCIFRRGRISNGSCKKSTSSTNNGQNSKQPNKPTVNDNTQSGNGYQKQRPHNFHNKYDTDDIPSNCKTISHSSSVPISICIIILISYIIFGTFLFHKILPWDILDSLYFCFTSLGTIGFGDKSPNGQIAQFAAAAYILIGMAVVAMCFSLIQSELVLWLRKCGVNDHTIQSPTDDIQLVTVTMTPKS